MNRLPENGDGSPIVVASVRLPEGFATTSAASLKPGVLSFGSEDGRVLLTDDDGKPLMGPTKISASGEAVNGVAWARAWLAVTTREETSFVNLPAADTDGV